MSAVVVSQGGAKRIRANPLESLLGGRNNDADLTAPASAMAPLGMRQGASRTLQELSRQGVNNVSVTGQARFGGNNPLVKPETNVEVRYTRVMDSNLLKEGDTEQGQLLFLNRKINTAPGQKIIQGKHNGRSLGRVNYHLRYGKGRALYGWQKNCLALREDIVFDGIQQTKMPPAGTANFNDTVAVTSFIGGPVHMADISCVNRQGNLKKRGRGRDRGGVMEQDSMFLVWQRVKEDNPYSLDRLGKGYDASQEAAWNDQKTVQSRQFYWRITCISSQDRTLDPMLYNSMDPNGVEDYIGFAQNIGVVLERVLRVGPSCNWASIASQAIFPTEMTCDYLFAYAKLPMLYVYLHT